MKTIKILLDTKTYGRKPEQDKVESTYTNKEGKEVKMYEAACVSFRLIKNQVDISVEELMNKIIEGYSWTVAHFSVDEAKGRISRTKQNWLGQDVFALDIDNGLSIEEALERCKTLKIMPTFIYTSFSDTPELRKFRIVFISEHTVTDYRDAHAMTLALMKMFPEADEQCKDLSRLYYGGKEIVYQEMNNKVTPKSIISAFCDLEYTKTSKDYKREIERFCAVTGLNTSNGLPKEFTLLNTDVTEKSAKKREALYIYIEVHGFTQVFDYSVSKEELVRNCTTTTGAGRSKKYNIEKSKIKAALIEKFDFDKLETNCPYWQALSAGTVYPYENEFMSVSTNLLKLKGGEKKLKEAISKSKVTPQATIDLYTDKITYYKNFDGIIRCEDFCPRYVDTNNDTRIDKDIVSACKGCENSGLNMLHSVSANRGEIRKVQEKVLKPLDIAETQLEVNMIKSMQATDTDIHLEIASTGIGKTTLLKKLADTYGFDKTIICYPNHTLGQDIVDRLQIENALHVKDLEIADRDIYDRYKELQSLADYSGAKSYLKDYMKTLKKHISTYTLIPGFSDIEAIQTELQVVELYLADIDWARKTSQPIFCTHARMLNLNNKNVDTIIIDEDIMKSCIKTIELSVDKIDVLITTAEKLNLPNTTGGLIHIKEVIETAKRQPGVVHEFNMKVIKKLEIRELIKHNTTGLHIYDLLRMKACIYNVTVNKSKSTSSKGSTFSTLIGYVKNELPNKKIIILSATANLEIYKAVFSDRVIHCNDLGPVESSGSLVLHHSATGKGFSRTSLQKDVSKAIDMIKKEAPGVTDVITFKGFKEDMIKAGFNADMHFGKCIGEDSLKGKDIVVLGTPHVNQAAYMMYAHAMGIRLNVEIEIEYQKTKRNGYEFSFSTFNQNDSSKEAELLREIQFYMIETELLQAIGRARILREPCTVHLFSNLPLGNCQLKKITK